MVVQIIIIINIKYNKTIPGMARDVIGIDFSSLSNPPIQFGKSICIL